MVMVKRVLGVFIILALLASSAPFFASTGPALAEDGEYESFSPELAEQVAEICQQKLSLTPVQRKIDWGILQVIREVRERVSALAEGERPRLRDLSTTLLKVDDAGKIDVKLTVTSLSDEQLEQLQGLGMDIRITLPEYGIIEGSLPYSQVEVVAGLDFVVNVGTPGYALHNTGGVNSEGDTVLRAAEARVAFGVDGSGVKVGVMSDGVTHLSDSVATGDLPAVDVLKAGSGDEGTAMLEIIHDLAPGSPLAFYTGMDSSSDMVAGIGALETAGCKVIVDDIGWSDEPKFEDGPIAQRARQFVTDGGVYVCSAGNSAQRHYFHQYVRTTGPGGDYDYAHDYGGGDIGNTFTMADDSTILTFLQWNNQWGASGDDFDLWLIRSTDGVALAASLNWQDGDDDPREWLGWTNNTGSPVTVYIAVLEYSLVNPPASMVLDYHVWYAPTLQYSIPENSVYGHSAVEEVLSTAAAYWGTPDTIESFSSCGPGTIYFPTYEDRQVPNITGVDGVQTKTGQLGHFGNPFYGTSASAPHVAAIAALVWEADPALTPSDVHNAITSTAVDKPPAGYDYTWGFGLADAYEAVASVIPSNTPPEVTNVTASQSSPTVDITYDVTDAEQSDVTISFEYWDGSSWQDCVTTTGEGTQSTGTGKSGTWNAKTDFDGKYMIDCKIQVTADDEQAANNTGSGESSPFTLDTKDPTGYGCDTPANGASGVSIDPNLTCLTASDDSLPISYYFQLAEDDVFTVNLQESSWQSSTTWAPSTLSYSTQYFWRVKAKDAYDNETDYNSTFNFTTGSAPNNSPNVPSSPSPADAAPDVSIDADLSWTGGDPDIGDTVTYDVYFGTSTTPPLVSGDQAATTYEPGTLGYNTHYYWKIVATDNHDASTEGSLWDFTTEAVPNNPPNAPTSLLCEGVTNPTGVTDPTPEFGWTFSDPDGGDTQGAYQILVASTPENLAADIGDMWDSGKVVSSDSEVSYGGAALADNQTYYWKVKNWDNHDAEGPYCGEQQFTTGTSPTEVWVDDSWAGLNHGDPANGHTFGTDAFATIQDGIDAVAGSTVHVAAGTYYENITLIDGVELLGAGADVTTIDSGGSGPVVTAIGVGSETKLDGFTITNGNADSGGGMYNDDSSPVVTNCTFSGNSALNAGGGMCNDESSPTVTNCTFTGNSTEFSGGGMYNYYSSPTATNCTFTGNSADYGGGGMCNEFCSPTVINCTFTGNSANYGGGGMFGYSSSPTVSNCIFSSNSATHGDGGGMYNESSYSPTITNCTFSGNSALNAGGGMCNDDSSPTVTNCILWDNGEEIYNEGGSSPVVTYCNIQGGYSGAGNIDADPLFVGGGDYHLQPGSPCIDAGNNSAPSLPSTDFESDPRIVDGDGDTVAVVDMGADEYYPDIRTPIDSIDFGDVAVGSNQDNTTLVYSDGTSALTINSVTWDSGSDEFSYVGPATPFNITAGQSQAVTVRFAPTSEGSKSAVFNVNSNDPDSPDVTFDVSGNGTPPPPAEAATEFVLDLDDDDASGGRAGITEVRDPITGDPLAVLVGGYEAEFSYNGSIVNILEVRLKPPFDTGASSINDPGGLTQFNGIAATGASAPVELAFLTIRLTGSVDEQCQGTLAFASVVDADGEPLGISPSEISCDFRRGDARADGEVDISDALFIAQYLAGLRDLGTGLDKVQAVNAGSVRHDNGFDEISISDVLFICQYLVGLRDGNMNLIE